MRFISAIVTLGALGVGLGTARLAHAEAPADFVAEARLFHRVVACGSTEPLPASIDAAIVDKHCAEMAKRYASYATRYLEPARTFFAGVRPAGVPTAVVYPFGGGDLSSALVTYPDAREVTTISLEHAGDPTRLATLTKPQLRAALAAYRAAVHGLLTLNDSTSENMRKLERGGIPGQLSFHITGLAAHGFEPVSLRYFTLAEDGTVRYLTPSEVAALAPKKARKKKGGWVDTDFSEAFTNMELAFRKPGDPRAPVIVHRHLAANLANKAFTGSPLERHLRAKGKVVALTKAASYLIWQLGVLGDPRLPAREHGVDGVGRDRHRAPPREEGRVHPGDLRHVQGRVPRGGRSGHQRGDGEAVGVPAPPQAAVPLRLPGRREARPPDDHPADRAERGAPAMIRPVARLIVLGLVLVASTGGAHARKAGPGGDGEGRLDKTEDVVEGGRHWRIKTAQGAVHVWIPPGYDRATAGTVVYVHGYWTSADGAWRDHDLARQFRMSKQNAMFVVPDAPASNDDRVKWPALTDLRRAVTRANIKLPDGPIIVIGHSGAFRTVMQWVDHRHVDKIILLDAMYAGEKAFDEFIKSGKRADEHRLIVVGAGTAATSQSFARRYKFAVTREKLPATASEFSKRERGAKLLYIHSQYEHMAIVTSKKVIPVLLRVTPLKPL